MKKEFFEMTSKEKLSEIKEYFCLCISDGKNRRKEKTPSLKFELDGDWLSIYYLNVKNYHPSDNPENSYNYKILASQDLKDYDKLVDIINRITLRLACELKCFFV